MDAYLKSVGFGMQPPARAGRPLCAASVERGRRGGAQREILRFWSEKTGVDPEMLPRTRSRSRVLGKDLFLEQEQVFAWPDKKAAETGGAVLFRAADQLGVSFLTARWCPAA